jgi:hypothetical protein
MYPFFSGYLALHIPPLYPISSELSRSQPIVVVNQPTTANSVSIIVPSYDDIIPLHNVVPGYKLVYKPHEVLRYTHYKPQNSASGGSKLGTSISGLKIDLLG